MRPTILLQPNIMEHFVMNRTLPLLILLLATSLAQASYVLDVPVHRAIPDADPAGIASVVTVSGQTGPIADLIVRLEISGTFNGDLYAQLTHGTGFTVLLNRPGRSAFDLLGYRDHGLDVTFSDSAAVEIHNYGGNGGDLQTGTFQPDARKLAPTEVLDTSPRTAMLSSFDGLDPNGEWVLFVADTEGGDLHELVSWGIEFTVVPEPSTFGALGALTMLSLAMLRRRQYLPQPPDRSDCDPRGPGVLDEAPLGGER